MSAAAGTPATVPDRLAEELLDAIRQFEHVRVDDLTLHRDGPSVLLALAGLRAAGRIDFQPRRDGIAVARIVGGP